MAPSPAGRAGGSCQLVHLSDLTPAGLRKCLLLEGMPERDQEMQENGLPEIAMSKASRRGSQGRATQSREAVIWRPELRAKGQRHGWRKEREGAAGLRPSKALQLGTGWHRVQPDPREADADRSRGAGRKATGGPLGLEDRKGGLAMGQFRNKA